MRNEKEEGRKGEGEEIIKGEERYVNTQKNKNEQYREITYSK